MPGFYGMGKVLGKVQFTLFAKWEVEGREAIPPRGPLIVAANHLSNADPPVIMCSFTRRLNFLAKEGLFVNRPITSFLRRSGAHPVKADGQDLRALRWSLRMLARDAAVLVFPEGTRSKTAALQEGKPGIGYLALRTQAPVLPVAVTGTERIPGMWRVAFPMCRIGVKIGAPFTLPAAEGKLSREAMRQASDTIMERIAQLLPPKYRGIYASRLNTGRDE